MAFGPLEIQGAIPRVQDFAAVRQHEDGKGLQDQMHASVVVENQTENKANTVNRGDEASNNRKNMDARDKGSNEYEGDGGRKKKKQDEASEGKVIVKGRTSFDIRI